MTLGKEIRIPLVKLTAQGYLHIPKAIREHHNLQWQQKFMMILIPLESEEDKTETKE